MEIRNEWKQTVSKRQFFFAVAFVVLLLGRLGIVFLQTGHFPQANPVFYATGLLVVWTMTLVQLFRYGKRAFPPLRIVFLLGVTLLFLGSSLLASYTQTGMALRNAGAITMALGYGASIFASRKPRQQLEA